jgi:threonine/homoserine/homoserine lactone efflux protein
VLAQVAGFVAVSVVVIVTPGPDTALTLRNTLLGGRGAGIYSALGVATGQACWTLAASAGIATLLAASEPAFLTVKLAGAAYLIFLGIQSLWLAFRRAPAEGAAPAREGSRRLRPAVAYRQGLVSDLANPKMAAFFTSLLPQFAPGEGGAFFVLLALGLLFCLLTFAWLAFYAVVAAKLGELLRRDRVRRAVEAVTGALLVGLGVRVALERQG